MLSLLIFLPALGALLIGFIRKERENAIKLTAILISLVVFFFALGLFLTYDPAGSGMQFEEHASWISELGISYHIGLDGISLFLVLLTTLIVPILLLAPWEAIKTRVKLFSMMILILETAVIGVFVSLDLILFYIFWEAMLIPMYFIIGIWGGARGSYAAIKFFLYTMTTSVLMLVAIIALYFLSDPHTFNLVELSQSAIPISSQLLLFGAFVAAFAVKIPLWPFHSWLPDAYSEAPTSGTILLSALMSKAGLYGLLRFGLTLFPNALTEYAPYLLVLAVIGVIYGALVAWAQKDLKRLIAYSSISHLSLVAIGILAFTMAESTGGGFFGGAQQLLYERGSEISLAGAILQMVNHGIIIAALFLALAILWDRFGRRGIDDFGGLAKHMPRFMVLFLIAMLGSVALPGTSGFVGEFLILLGAFMTKYQTYAIIAATIAILSAVYMLWMTRKVFHGPVNEELVPKMKDLSGRESWTLVPLVVLILVMGIFPNLWLDRISPSVDELLTHASERSIESMQLDNEVAEASE